MVMMAAAMVKMSPSGPILSFHLSNMCSPYTGQTGIDTLQFTALIVSLK